ncbi:MAG TPA: nuclear transport factor 2 family protein [Steroidobacteraceae bacterium]|nr:nuclear transport factor 2 family protein [Steroidobacteraceae bacterium]
MTTIRDVERALERKYALCEELFKAGDMARAVRELYTENVCYLTGDLRLLRGRAELTAFFEAIHAQIGAVHVEPVLTYGDPDTVVYQFCNTTRRMAGSDQIVRAHYVAAFRRVGDDWLMEMEVPALGAIGSMSR